MRLRTLQIADVSRSHLCCGCGACAYVNPRDIRMVDDLERGRRPSVRVGDSDRGAFDEAVEVCPGLSLKHDFIRDDPQLITELTAAWGPVREIWEGHATDSQIRFAGSSGGVASALALFCVERFGMHGLLHITSRSDVPYLNHTVLSTNRDQILAATGSRYAPASPCDGLQLIEDAPAPCVFIGKPCDVAATSKTRRLRPALDAKLGLTIALFCAGTPSTRGTLEMLRHMGVDDPSAIRSLRYRGNGWPGRATIRVMTPSGEQTRELSYQQSWGEILERHRQWRCYVCLDHSGEFADISIGDPWYRPIQVGDIGQSLVLVRSERGRQVVKAAIDAGYLSLARADPSIVDRSQPGFRGGRGRVWGRVLTCRMLGVATPRYGNMPSFAFWWWNLTCTQKVRAFVGTVRRVFRKGLLRPAPVIPFEPPISSGFPVNHQSEPVEPTL